MGGALGCVTVDQATVGLQVQFGKAKKVVAPGVHFVQMRDSLVAALTSIACGGGKDMDLTQDMKHALVIPLAAQAHVAGMYRFALQLARRGVTITFVTMAEDVPKMKAYEELQGLDFRLISYSPLLITASSVENFSGLEKFIIDAGVHFKPILEELKARKKSGVPGPTCVVYDRFCTWVGDVAEELKLPLYTFFSCGAILARYLKEVPRLFSEEGPLKIKQDGTLQNFEGIVNVSGLPPLTFADLPGSTRLRPQNSLNIAKTMEKAELVIVNTFYELEYPQIDAMEQWHADQARTSGRKKTELFLVGPLSSAASFQDVSFTRLGPKAEKTDTKAGEFLQWLNGQPPQSVLFICMGSLYHWNPLQVYELALALESSGQRFLWVLPLGDHISSLEAVLPAGFEERMRGMGLVASGWVPQLQILSHGAVGGFLTHCGWNSLIESISSGVPVICWPEKAEQFMNRRYFVDVLKIGVNVGPGELGSTFVPHENFEKAFRLLMVEDEGKAIRSKVQKLMLSARAAVTAGGASCRALDEISTRIPGNYTNVPA
ncbi:hypothetical protein R1sor_011490 [Riccia sorocarpa]|uniref:Glycosyltransferase n=1 Tax=Riccia sorocarpa TaxID=122646 RepID=A0ABD3I727_9MARC